MVIVAISLLRFASGYLQAGEPIEGDIVDLIAGKKIAAEIQGEEIRTVKLRVRRLVSEPVTVRVPVGTLFVSRSGTVQNMVALEALSIPLQSGEWSGRDVSVACVNLRRPIPDGDARFAIQRAPNQKALAIVMPKLVGQNFAVQQAAVWIITDNARLSDLRSLIVQTRTVSTGGFPGAPLGGGIVSSGPLISPSDGARALRLCAAAGLDITALPIWADRRAMNADAEKSGEEELAGWMKAQQSGKMKRSN